MVLYHFCQSVGEVELSDKTITQDSGFFNCIEPGDVILADRGFTIEDDIAVYGAKLIIPSFTRGKKQLSLEDVERSKQLSQVRIHVERVIGLLKNKFTILKGPIPVNVIKHNILTLKLLVLSYLFCFS